MLIKKLFLFKIFLFSSIMSFSQEWAPVGAEWYYDISYTYPGYDYHRVYCDTILSINGKDCKRININKSACNNHYTNKLYTYELNDTVFFYNSDIDSFQILYNFNTKAGDTWIINPVYYPEKINTVEVLVDSIATEIINNHTLKKLFVTYTYKDFWDKYGGSDKIEKSTITEVLGDHNLIINITDPGISICDVDFIHSLRCYQDNDFGFYSTNLRNSCTYTWFETSTNNNSNSEIFIYPNPSSNYITIESKNPGDINYKLYNSSGQLIKFGTNEKINLTNILPGIYLLKVFDGDKLLISDKIIKL